MPPVRPPSVSRAVRLLAAALSSTPDEAGSVSAEDLERVERMHQRELAQRLHDGPLQDVISALQDVVDLRAGEDVDLADVESALRSAVAGMRDAGRDLYDDDLLDDGLPAALDRVAAAVAGDDGPEIDVRVADDASTEHDELVVSATRELLQNVRKHADAEAVRVVVERSAPALLRLEVHDDGVGLDEDRRRAAAGAGHLGLRSIDDRARHLGGSLHVGSDGGDGTVVSVLLPVRPDRRRRQLPVSVERRRGAQD